MKEAVQRVYLGLQEKSGGDDQHFLGWAEENPTEFYKIAAKLMPLDVNANLSTDKAVTINLTRQSDGNG